MCFARSLLFAAVMCQPAAALEITIHVYDYAGIQPGALAEAQHSAERTLGAVGIAVRWRNCLVAASGVPDSSTCGSGTEDPTHFVVSMLPEHMAQKISPLPQQFGMAVTGQPGGFPTHAYVFFDRIRDFAKGEMGPWNQLLGTVIAHEVGHLLLGVSSHFPVGIMRGQWRLGEMKQAFRGAMTFTPEQAGKMRGDVQRRELRIASR